MGENIILWVRSYLEQEMRALQPCSNSSVGDGTLQKFPPREKNCLQPPTTKVWMGWQERVRVCSLLDSPEPPAERPKGLPLMVGHYLPLVTASEAAHGAGSDKCVLSPGKGLQDCTTASKYVVLLPFYCRTGRRVRHSSFSPYWLPSWLTGRKKWLFMLRQLAG